MYYYEIKNEDGGNEGTEILALFYGNLWESALNRLNHECDGMLLTLFLDGRKYFIYRRMKS